MQNFIFFASIIKRIPIFFRSREKNQKKNKKKTIKRKIINFFSLKTSVFCEDGWYFWLKKTLFFLENFTFCGDGWSFWFFFLWFYLFVNQGSRRSVVRRIKPISQPDSQPPASRQPARGGGQQGPGWYPNPPPPAPFRPPLPSHGVVGGAR